MGVELYVGQLSGRVTEEEIRKLFTLSGTVTSIHLIVDPVSGEFRGCGYVRMSSEDEAREAVDLLDGAMLGGRVIVVKEALKKPARKPGSFGGRSGKPGSSGKTGSTDRGKPRGPR